MSGNLHLNKIKVTVKSVNNNIDEVYNIMFYVYEIVCLFYLNIIVYINLLYEYTVIILIIKNCAMHNERNLVDLKFVSYSDI